MLRARSGFDINQLVAEYRALRASVLRLWMDLGDLERTAVGDMIRFNEAIDQAVAESVARFHRTVEAYRNLLLGMLGHDMRNPLSAIIMTAAHLGALNAGDEISEAATRLMRSGASMQTLLDDLTDFNRTNLGLGLKIAPAQIDLAKAVGDELDQLRAAHPERRIEFAMSGDSRGRWDGKRMQQVLRNLVSNAIKHGARDMPVRVVLHGEQTEVRLEVSNTGRIDPAEIWQIFEPLRRGAAEQSDVEGRDGLGLGLFIVREIAKAHGGDAEVRCEEEQTTFAVRLPRQAGS